MGQASKPEPSFATWLATAACTRSNRLATPGCKVPDGFRRESGFARFFPIVLLCLCFLPFLKSNDFRSTARLQKCHQSLNKYIRLPATSRGFKMGAGYCLQHEAHLWRNGLSNPVI